MRQHASSVRIAITVALLFAALSVTLWTFAPRASAAGSPAPAANPDLQPACATKVVLILDESGSIGNTAGAEQAVRDAANAFARGLADTGSQLAVIEFSGSAKRVFDYTTVTSGAGGTLATTFQPYFDGTATSPADVYSIPTQLLPWTNWEAALKEVALVNAQSVAPWVVFITDGDPTATNTPSGGVQTNVPSSTAVNPAITQANAIKAQGSHILAVGVGAALKNPASLARLSQVSGPEVVTSAASIDLAKTDVLNISEFSALPDALQTIVRQLCKPPVPVPVTPSVSIPVPTTIGSASQTRLAIDKRGPSTARSGAVITYAVKVTNAGAVTAQNVVMRDKIPTSMSLFKKPAGVQLAKGFVVVQVGTLAPAASQTIRLQVRIDLHASGSRTNTATASASNARTVRDSARTRIIELRGGPFIPGVTG